MPVSEARAKAIYEHVVAQDLPQLEQDWNKLTASHKLMLTNSYSDDVSLGRDPKLTAILKLQRAAERESNVPMS